MAEAKPRDLYRAERTVFFSDGVFAIALTLLAVELRVPPPGEAGLLMSLIELWPRTVSFLTSFFLVSVVWFNHHALFHHLHRVDRPLILLNLFLLLNIIGMPFISGLLGEYIASDRGEEGRIAALAYGCWVTWGGIPFNLLWRYAERRTDLHADHSLPAARKSLSLHFVLGPFLYGLATALALLSVWVSLACFALLILFYFLPPRSARRRMPHG